MNEPFEPRRFKGKTAGVLGLGLSGQACAKLLARKGFKVFGSDTRPKAELKKVLSRLPSRISWEGGGHTRRLERCGFVVKSPGLPPHLPILARLSAAGVPVYSELEVAMAYCRSKEIIAITGTNGKTTTTALTGEIFKKARRPNGRRVIIAGNIGVPVSAAAPAARPQDTVVLEVSSYQLEDSAYFHPHAAAILNITADHLDHHGSMARYVEAKARVFQDQGPEDACVFNALDPIAVKLSRRCPSAKLFFGRKGHAQAWVEAGRLRVRLPGAREAAIPLPRLPGEHNRENAMAAALLAMSRGVPASAAGAAMKAFRGVEHRLEEAGTFHGIRCINDSKATNVDSTLVALKALEDRREDVLLILGGLHKGSPYLPLKGPIERAVKGILTIGSAARKVEEDLSGVKPIFPCGDLRTAVETAFKIGSKGDILLLSPACASFDQFKNFEDRGRQFKDLVRGLA